MLYVDTQIFASFHPDDEFVYCLCWNKLKLWSGIMVVAENKLGGGRNASHSTTSTVV